MRAQSRDVVNDADRKPVTEQAGINRGERIRTSDLLRPRQAR
jgi:hypothetical protein